MLTRSLWVWWTACSLVLFYLWLSALESSDRALLSQRQACVTAGLRELTLAFASVEQLQRVLVESREPLEVLQSQARPYAQLYPLEKSPAWVQALVSPRIKDLDVVRPLPPGMEAGRFPARLPPGTPESYYLTANHRLVTVLDLDYLYGPWLHKKLQSWGLDLQSRRVDSETTWREPRTAPQGLDDVMRWRVPTLLADDPYPFDAVELELDNRPALRYNFLHYAALLGLGSLVMLSFAASIALAARGVRRELELVEARNQFMAMVSHELRTPAAAIQMYVEILENQLVDDAEKIKTYHRILGEQSGRLTRLVENLLELGSLERGARPFRRQPVDLNELVRECGAPEMVLEEGLPLVAADPEAMRQVLGNLLDNARKYAQEPMVVTRRTPNTVVLEVQDRGPGIAEAERERIFEPYRRLAGAEPGAKHGVGLGLAIVRGFVQGQGGTVEVEARPGGGAIFRLEFPL